jgi:8-oxo-dGTP diphosphatase
MPYTYDYPHPAVTTDVVIFTIRGYKLEVLLVKRRNDPFAGSWALPGGFVDSGEDLDHCAKRELFEETGVDGIYLEQLYTFGAMNRDPRERVITVAYFALVPAEKLPPARVGSDSEEVGWFAVDTLPALAFDHAEIIRMARDRVSAKARYSTVALHFLPGLFTLSELQRVYEVLLQESLDKRNFRKWILSLKCIVDSNEVRRSCQHRPARLYRATEPNTVRFIK